MAISKNSYNLKDKMKNSRLSTILIILFLIFLPNFLAGQQKSDNKNDDAVNSKVLEERIKQIEDKNKIQIEGLEKRTDDQKNDLKELMNLYVWFVGIFVTFILGTFSYVGYKVVIGWIKKTIKDKTDEYLKKENIPEIIKKEGEDAVNKLLLELETKGKEKIEEIDKLQNDYENALNRMKDIKDIKDIDIDKLLPKESKEYLTEFEDKLAKFKKEER